jgi:uncharacterized protein YegJ (DUF2314 family)
MIIESLSINTTKKSFVLFNHVIISLEVYLSSTATTPCDVPMKDEPITDTFKVTPITTDGKVTSLLYTNPEDVMLVKQPTEGVVYTPKSKDNVCTFKIVAI